RSNRPAEADRDIAQTDARYRQMLAGLGVDSLAAAQQRQAEAQQKSAELELARQRLADLAPQGVAQLQAEIAQLSEASAGDLELKGDLAQLRVMHAAAEQKMDAARNNARQLQPMLAQIVNDVVAAEAALAGILAD